MFIAHIRGHSLGASIAQELALGFPEKVIRLILVSSSCGGSESVPMQPETLARLTDKSGTVQEMTSRMFSLLFLAEWLARHEDWFDSKFWEYAGIMEAIDGQD